MKNKWFSVCKEYKVVFDIWLEFKNIRYFWEDDKCLEGILLDLRVCVFNILIFVDKWIFYLFKKVLLIYINNGYMCFIF